MQNVDFLSIPLNYLGNTVLDTTSGKDLKLIIYAEIVLKWQFSL